MSGSHFTHGLKLFSGVLKSKLRQIELSLCLLESESVLTDRYVIEVYNRDIAFNKDCITKEMWGLIHYRHELRYYQHHGPNILSPGHCS